MMCEECTPGALQRLGPGVGRPQRCSGLGRTSRAWGAAGGAVPGTGGRAGGGPTAHARNSDSSRRSSVPTVHGGLCSHLSVHQPDAGRKISPTGSFRPEVTGSLAPQECPTPAAPLGIEACAIVPRTGPLKVLYGGSLGGRWHARRVYVRMRACARVCACMRARVCACVCARALPGRGASGSGLKDGVFPSPSAPGHPPHADRREAGRPPVPVQRCLCGRQRRAPLRRPDQPAARLVQHARHDVLA